ncbi:MAG: TldD/PmbA family protein [bacterium]|nr:TldD/PmbA family protein [bacterium]
MTHYLELAKDVVNKIAAQGVEAEAIIVDERSTEIRVDQGQIEQLAQNGSKGMGIRVIDGGRVGYAYTSDFSDRAVEETARAALELAQIATPDDFRGLPDPQPISEEDLEIFDPKLDSVPTDAKIDLALNAEKAAFAADPRVFNAQSNYGDAIIHVSIANSRGVAASYSRTAAYGYIFCTARDDAGDQAQGLGMDVSNFYNELSADRIGQEAAQKAVLTLGATTVKTQTGSVVLDPFIMAQLLATLSMAMTGEAMQRGRSFLVDKLGQEIGTDKVTLLDNARLKRGLNSAPFDGEGVPTSATRLVDEGMFQNVIYDTYTAKRAGTKSTGNAQRDSHRTLPRLGGSNFYIQPGNESPEDIIAGVEHGIYVTRIMQTGGINPVTGDCSMAASGVWIENGKLTHPVNGVTLATTLPDLLRNVTAVGSDLRFVPFFGAIGSPTVRVDNMTIGGTV